MVRWRTATPAASSPSAWFNCRRAGAGAWAMSAGYVLSVGLVLSACRSLFFILLILYSLFALNQFLQFKQVGQGHCLGRCQRS